MIKEKITIDFNSVTSTRPIEIVDNNSNHTPTSYGGTVRITPEAINKESCYSLESKVNQVVPNLLNLEDGDKLTIEVATSSGTRDITVGIQQKDGKYHIFRGSGVTADSTVSVSLPKSLEKRNKFGDFADLQRAVLMLVAHYLNFPFQPARREEKGFLKIKKLLCL